MILKRSVTLCDVRRAKRFSNEVNLDECGSVARTEIDHPIQIADRFALRFVVYACR
jgi:hypothetical protein